MYDTLKKLADIKIILSVIGGFFVCQGTIETAFIGHTIWFFSNILWLKHFYNVNDKSAYIMYWIWQLQAIYGMISWGLII